MLNKEDKEIKINEIYEKFKVKNFDTERSINGAEKGRVVTRVNKRLYNFISRKVNENFDINDDEVNTYINRQVNKLDFTKKQKREKRDGTEIFKTDWGEDIYRKNAFLGAEINQVEEFMNINKKIVNYIQQQEKINKKPSNKEVNKKIEFFITEAEKNGLNDSSIFRRRSTKHVLEAFFNNSEPYSMPYSDEDIKSGSAVYLKIETNSLSYAELRELKKIFENQIDESGNIVMLLAGIVDAPIDSPKTDLAEIMALKEISETFLSESKRNFSNENEELKEIKSKIENNISESLKNFEENNKKNKKENQKIKKNINIYNLVIFLAILLGIIIVWFKV